jgi:CTP:molybdopterin cytidylyltransferase MocA
MGVSPMQHGRDGHATGRVAAIVLAAGRSSRMGTFKPLLDFDGRAMIARVIESLRDADLSTVVVVTGHRAADVAGAVADIAGVTIVHNPDHAAGEMLSSVQTGVRALPIDVTAFVLAHGDQPAVRPATIRQLIAESSAPDVDICSPEYAGEHGHPVVLSNRLIPAVLDLPTGSTLKELVHARAAARRHVRVDDPAVLADVDTPADYAHALRLWREQQPPASPRRAVPSVDHVLHVEGAPHAP